MTKEEYDEYQESLKNYRDMYLIENEYKRELAERDSTIAVMRKSPYGRTKSPSKSAF